MAKITGNRHGHKARHKTVTESAAKVYQALLANKIVGYPGAISSTKGHGGALRLTLIYEPSRIRIVINGQNSQEMFVYGKADRYALENILRLCNPDRLTIRDYSTTEPPASPG